MSEQREPGWYEASVVGGLAFWDGETWRVASPRATARDIGWIVGKRRIHPPGEVSEAPVAAVSRAIFPIISRWAYRDHAKDNRTTEAVANEAARAAISALSTPSNEALIREVERRREAEAEMRQLRALLKKHHDWHLNSGAIGLPDGDGGWIEIDNAAEYGDSAMYAETQAALDRQGGSPNG